MQYTIIGEPMPVVQCDLQAGESMKTEKGSMAWMTPNMQMETKGAGGLGKALGRMVSGESAWQNIYTAQGGPGMVTFGSSFTGSIRPVQITPQKSIICQKSSFLASEMGVELSIHMQQRIGAGLVGGEGFVMQKLTGNGLAFLEIDGYAVEYDLAANQSLVLDTGSLAYCDDTCQIDIQQVKGLKNKLLGGEGFFNTLITGPGHVVLQTMSISGFASALAPFIASGNK